MATLGSGVHTSSLFSFVHTQRVNAAGTDRPLGSDGPAAGGERRGKTNKYPGKRQGPGAPVKFSLARGIWKPREKKGKWNQRVQAGEVEKSR